MYNFCCYTFQCISEQFNEKEEMTFWVSYTFRCDERPSSASYLGSLSSSQTLLTFYTPFNTADRTLDFYNKKDVGLIKRFLMNVYDNKLTFTLLITTLVSLMKNILLKKNHDYYIVRVKTTFVVYQLVFNQMNFSHQKNYRQLDSRRHTANLIRVSPGQWMTRTLAPATRVTYRR